MSRVHAVCATRGVVDGLLIRPGDVECTIVPTAVVGGAGDDAGGKLMAH